MVQHQESVRTERQLSVRTPVIVTELDLVRTVVKSLHHRARLAADEPVLGKVNEQGDDVEDVDGDRAGHDEAQKR